MKNIYKLFLALTLVLGVSSCQDSDLYIDELLETVGVDGVILRTLQQPADLVNNSSAPSIDFEIEVQEGDGSEMPDFKEVRVYLNVFDDQDQLNRLEGTSEEWIWTIPADDFYINELTGLPAYTFNIPTELVLETFPEDTVYPIPTFIYTRLECEMNDGTVYSTDNVAASVGTGDFYQSPYGYNTIYIND